MGKLFHEYGEIYDYMNESGNKNNLYVVVNNNFIIEEGSSLKHVSSISSKFIENVGNSMDFLDNSSKEILFYLAYRREQKWNGNKRKIICTTYIFKKYKLYHFERTGEWYDEVGNMIDSYNDIWYDPFLFVKPEDKEKAIRYLKLKKLKK